MVYNEETKEREVTRNVWYRPVVNGHGGSGSAPELFHEASVRGGWPKHHRAQHRGELQHNHHQNIFLLAAASQPEWQKDMGSHQGPGEMHAEKS